MEDILRRVQIQHKANPQRREQERLKAKAHGVSSQLDAIAERIAELPKGISAAPLYKQMARLEGLKNEHEAALLEIAMGGKNLKQRIVGTDTFYNFASHYRAFLRNDVSVPDRKQAVQKFIRKIEVGTETVRIHYIVDNEHFKRELASKDASSRPDFFCNVSSNTLTFGAPGQT